MLSFKKKLNDTKCWSTAPTFKKLLVVVCCLPLAGLQGCATIMSGTTKTVSVRTEPSGANFMIYRNGEAIHTGISPQTVELKKRGKYTIRIEKEGYEPMEVPIRKRLSGWYVAGNMVFGGLVGWLIVDPLSGAMFTFSDKSTKFVLDKKVAMLNQQNDAKDGLIILSMNDIPLNQRAELVPLIAH